jgi:hypothetical protein
MKSEENFIGCRKNTNQKLEHSTEKMIGLKILTGGQLLM